MNLWFVLILGMSSWSWGDSPTQTTTQPAPAPATQPAIAPATQPAIAPASPVSSRPTDTAPAPEAARDGRVVDRPPPTRLDEYLLMVTGNNEPEVRLIGARRLLEAGTEEAATRLAQVLRAAPPDASAQMAVCRAIAEFKKPPGPGRGRPGSQGATAKRQAGTEAAERQAGAEAAERQAGAEVAKRQAGAEVATRQAGSEAVISTLAEPVLALLGTERPGVNETVNDAMNEAVTQALRRFESSGVIERLRVLAADVSAKTARREAAIHALGEMCDDLDAVGALVALAPDENRRIQEAALTALAQATGVRHADSVAALAWWEDHKSTPPMDWLRGVSERRAAKIRGLHGQTTRLIDRLTTSYRDSYLRTPEPDRAALLVAFLSDELAEVRLLGLDLINTRITDRKEVSEAVKAHLVEMIADPDPVVRHQVAARVGDLRPEGAVPRLVEAVAVEPDHRVRGVQVNAIGRLDGIAAIPALIERLDDDIPTVVGEAAAALAQTARRVLDQPKVLESVETALAARFLRIPIRDEELRERFLHAMTRIGAVSFRTVFEAELAADRSLRTRRAAIAGLAAYGNEAAADDVRPWVSAAEPEIRLEAVGAMAKCGHHAKDLEALEGRLDSAAEPDPAIRERAWESYLAVSRRLAPKELPVLSDRFARTNDQTAQRRRLAVLAALIAAPQRFKQLSIKERIGVHERMAEAQLELDDSVAAAVSLDLALALDSDLSSPRFASLAARLVAALLKGRQDEAAAQRIEAFVAADEAKGVSFDAKPLARAVSSAVRSRIDAATDAASQAEALELIELMSSRAANLGPELVSELSAAGDDLTVKRMGSIDRLLGSIARDPQAEAALLTYGRDLVLPRLHARLTAMPVTTAPANDIEGRLVELAKKLAEPWPGYAPGGSPEARAKALDMLEATWTRSAPAPASAPTTAPAEAAP